MKPVLTCISLLVALMIWTVCSSSTAVGENGCHGPTLAKGCAGQPLVVSVRCAGPLRSILVRGVERRQHRRALRQERRAARLACYGIPATTCAGSIPTPATCNGN